MLKDLPTEITSTPLTISFAFSTVNSPVVVAVVVDSTLAIKEKAIFAEFLSQGAVGTLVEGIAAIWVRIQLESLFLWALVVTKLCCGCGEKGRITLMYTALQTK